MTADRWIVLLALCFICVSSNEEQNSSVCKTHTLSAPLGSSVLLPCNFATIKRDWVSWAHTLKGDLVHIKSEGRIRFLDHRYGRVRVFPNQGSEGNYSIFIDELNNSDLGRYRCKQGHDCLQVELVAERDALSEEMTLLIFICVGVAAFILLSVCGYYCTKCKLCCNNRKQDNTNNPEGAGTEGVSATPEETGRAPVEQQQRGAGNDHLVYENDDQGPSNQQNDPTRNYCSPISEVLPDPQGTQPIQSVSGIYPNLNQFERMESQRKKQGFHRELFSRLRQASLSRHYYGNIFIFSFIISMLSGISLIHFIIQLTKVKSASNKPCQLRQIIAKVWGRKKPKKMLNAKTRFTTGAQTSSTAYRESKGEFKQLILSVSTSFPMTVIDFSIYILYLIHILYLLSV